MNIQADGHEVDVRVLRVGPDDRLLLTVPDGTNHNELPGMAQAISRWSGVPMNRIIVIPIGVALSILRQTEERLPE